MKFLTKLTNTRHSQSDPALKLKCKVLFDQSEFETLYQIIQNHSFHRDYHRDLQTLWNDAHYKEVCFLELKFIFNKYAIKFKAFD